MKLLLHMCCAPCAAYPVHALREDGIEPQGLFYNPNIHPLEEYTRRREGVEQYRAITGLAVHFIEGFMQREWEAYEGEALSRCQMCYALRMDEVARFAAANGFDAFTTTLLVSPYQKHELIVSQCEAAAKAAGMRFYYRDFRPGFRQGQNMAREMGLYRQKYCGCIRSFNPETGKAI